jgi:hypothetical protein
VSATHDAIAREISAVRRGDALARALLIGRSAAIFHAAGRHPDEEELEEAVPES